MTNTHERTPTERHTQSTYNNTNTMCRCTRLHQNYLLVVVVGGGGGGEAAAAAAEATAAGGAAGAAAVVPVHCFLLAAPGGPVMESAPHVLQRSFPSRF